MVHTVLETILKSLHICAFDFSYLSTAFIILKHFLLLVVYEDIVAMRLVIENESKSLDLDLGSVCHNDRDKSDIVKREEAGLALKT